MATKQAVAPFTSQQYLIVWTFPTVEGPWIKDFGIQFEVTAVVSDAEFAAMWPMVEAAASVS